MLGLLKSFQNAFKGIYLFFISERNARIQLIIFLLVLAVAFILKVNNTQWLMLIAMGGLVFSLEALNTAIEALCDVLKPEWDERIKRIKDLAAGAVLIASIIAAIVGSIIFLPYLLAWLK